MSALRLIRAPGHDLPPRWDGCAVVWRGWESLEGPICGSLPSDCCEQCGSLAQPTINVGLVADDPEMTQADAEHDDRAVKTAHKMRLRRKRQTWIRLTAFRCPDCRGDTVLEHGSGECWVLDDSDYGDAGSVAPPEQGTLL